MLVPINITGNSYKFKSRSLTAQVTRNLHPIKINDDGGAAGEYVLENFVGQSSLSAISGLSRGLYSFRNILYRVLNQTLYSINNTGYHFALGSVPGLDRCIFTGVGSSLVIVTGGHVYIYSGVSVTEATDSDLESPNSATHLNNQIIYDGNDGRFSVSDVGDASSIDGLNYATAESDVDGLIRVYAFEEQLYLFGEKTIERWWNSGVGSPPFDRIQGGIIQRGLGALHSVADNGEYMFFLANNWNVYALRGGTEEKISTLALADEFAGYADKEDAFGWAMTLKGEDYYVLSFVAANKTWVYKKGLGWFEWSSGAEGGRSLAVSYAYCYGKHYVDVESGGINELDFDVYEEAGEEIIRVRDSAPLDGFKMGAAGKRLTMSRLEMICETGVGLVSGQGSDPVVMISFSDDGGKTFSLPIQGRLGVLGQYQWKIEWHALGSFFSRIIRVEMSDPVFLSIHRMNADIEVGI